MERLITKTNLKYYFVAIISISGILISISIQEGHKWGGDFSLYINQSIHIAEGFTLDELYEWNKTSMQNSQKEIGPYLYPNGFPLLLSPIFYFFGIDFVVMKIFCSLFFLFSIPFIYNLFRGYFKQRLYPFVLVCLIALNWRYIRFSDNILSDFPYMFFCFLTLYLMVLKSNLTNQLLLGCCLFLAYFIRDVGVLLLPTIFIYHIINTRRHKDNIVIIVPYLIFALLFFLARTVFPNGGENHFEMLLSELSFDLIKKNFNYYNHFFSKIFFFNISFSIIGYLIIVLASVGAFSKTKKHLPFIVFTILNLTILMIWPSTQGIRFLFTIYPFILFFIIQGIIFILEKKNANVKYYTKVAITLYLITFSFQSLIIILAVSKVKSNHAYTTEMVEIYNYISLNIPAENIIGFRKPRVLYLFSGVKSIYTDIAHFDESIANYLLIKKEPPNEYEHEMIQKEFQNYILLRNKKSL